MLQVFRRHEDEKVWVGCGKLFSRTEYLKKHEIKCNQEKTKLVANIVRKSLVQSETRLSMRSCNTESKVGVVM